MTKKKSEPHQKTGRPSTYTPELGELICERVATHDIGLNRLCEMYDDMPAKITVNQWRYKHPEFATRYDTAKRVQADLLAESLDDIAHETHYYTDGEGNKRMDSGFIAHLRLRVDTRKFIAAKLLPRIYGADPEQMEPHKQPEKLVINTTDPVEASRIYQEFMQRSNR